LNAFADSDVCGVAVGAASSMSRQLSIAELLRLQPKKAHRAVCAQLVEEEARLGLSRLCAEQQHYLLASHLNAEVCNGGLEQFFTNSSGKPTGPL
jgi:hypothetical protein